MANKKDKDSIEQNIGKYENYFKDDLAAIQLELDKSNEYSKIIDKEIEKLSAPTLGMNKGSQHYLIEHITNAVQLQTQRQGLRKDRFIIKKTIMDYSEKFADEREEGSKEELAEELAKILEKDREEKADIEKPKDSANLDSIIDEELNKENK